MQTKRELNCSAFICKHDNNGICIFADLPCSKLDCTGFYLHCDSCTVSTCPESQTYAQLEKLSKKEEPKKEVPQKVYAVKNGRRTGVFSSWQECKKQVEGFSNAQYKAFNSMEEANKYLKPVCDNKMPEKPYAYVDGSFYNGTYGYGGFVVDNKGERHLLQGSGRNPEYVGMQNIAGEIRGAIAAIELAMMLKFEHLTIYYDYLGIEKWATGEWKANKPGTIEYQNFVKSCPVKLYFKKVKGHSGIAGNELADRLAKEAIGVA